MIWPFHKKKHIELPKIVTNGQSHSEEARRQSEQKLRDTVQEGKEIRKVSSKSNELTRLNGFAEALERSMRRSRG